MSTSGSDQARTNDNAQSARHIWTSTVVFGVLPGCLLTVFVALAWLFLHMRPSGTVKVVVVHAFSGPLHDQGYDALSAVRAATNTVTGQRGVLEGRRLEVEALDDEGSATRVIAQLDAIAVDAHVFAVICCSTEVIAASTATQLVSRPSVRFPLIFPSRLSSEEASGAVSIVVRHLQPRRAVLIRMGSADGDTYAAAVMAQTTPVVVDAALETGLALDDVATKAVGSHPDLVFIDVPSPMAALLIARIRADGFRGPLTGPDELASSEMVTWTGAPLGAMFVPSWLESGHSGALEQTFATERGHAPSQVDRLFYEATVKLLSSNGKVPSPDSKSARGPWIVAQLIPGQFPPRPLLTP